MITPKTLAMGVLPLERTKLLECLVGDRLRVDVMKIANQLSTNVKVTVWKVSNGISIPITPISFNFFAGYMADIIEHQEDLNMKEGDTIEGMCDTDSAVPYLIEGNVESPIPN